MMVAKSIQAMADRIVREFHPVRLILFGSHARGDAGPQSDIDLLVVLPQVSDKRRAAVVIRRALADFSVSKDIIVATPEEIARRGDLVGTVLRPAPREGKVLIEIPPKCAGKPAGHPRSQACAPNALQTEQIPHQRAHAEASPTFGNVRTVPLRYISRRRLKPYGSKRRCGQG